MTIIRPNSISGINSITAKNTDQMKLYDSNGSWSHVRAGVITATSFVGNVTGGISGGAVSGSTGTFSSDVTISGNLGVAGTVTYEDVSRVDATGISTFREGFNLGPLAGIALTAYKDGSIRTTGIITATNLKVGPSNSTRPISIYSASDAHIQFQGSGTGTSNGNADGFIVGNGGTNDATLWNYENGYIRFGANNTERLRITSAGLVGINQTPTTAQLVVKNSNDSSLNSIDVFNDNGNVSTSISQDSTGAGSFVQKDNSGTIKTFIKSYGASYFTGGNLLIGATAVEDWDSSRSHHLQITGATYQTAGMSILDTQNDDNPGEIVLGKSRGTGNTIVQSADDVGQIRWSANDGNGFHSIAHIRCSMDGTTGSNDLPSKLTFATCGDGGTSVQEAMSINSSGYHRWPSLPTFHVNGSPTITNNPGGGSGYDNSVHSFGAIRHNNGSHYNNSNGRFTAPMTGYYHFTGGVWSSNSNQDSGTYLLKLMLNGSSDLVGCNHTEYQNQLTVAATVYMTSGQTANLNYNGSIQGSSPRNYFTGHLVG